MRRSLISRVVPAMTPGFEHERREAARDQGDKQHAPGATWHSPYCLVEPFRVNVRLDHIPQMGSVDRHQHHLDILHHDLHMRHGTQVVRHALLQTLHALLHVLGGCDVLGGVLSDADLPRRGVLRIEVGQRLPRIRQSARDIESLLTQTVLAMQCLAGAHLREVPTHSKCQQMRAQRCQPGNEVLGGC